LWHSSCGCCGCRSCHCCCSCSFVLVALLVVMVLLFWLMWLLVCCGCCSCGCGWRSCYCCCCSCSFCGFVVALAVCRGRNKNNNPHVHMAAHCPTIPACAFGFFHIVWLLWLFFLPLLPFFLLPVAQLVLGGFFLQLACVAQLFPSPPPTPKSHQCHNAALQKSLLGIFFLILLLVDCFYFFRPSWTFHVVVFPAAWLCKASFLFTTEPMQPCHYPEVTIR